MKVLVEPSGQEEQDEAGLTEHLFPKLVRCASLYSLCNPILREGLRITCLVCTDLCVRNILRIRYFIGSLFQTKSEAGIRIFWGALLLSLFVSASSTSLDPPPRRAGRSLLNGTCLWLLRILRIDSCFCSFIERR